MNKYGFKKGLVFGLLLYCIGAFLFYPAAEARSYNFFLFALFVIAAGATFLETVANPYITKLGDPATATQRLNFAQSFNGVGAFVAPIIGGKFILSGIEHSESELAAMQTNGTLNAYLQTEADTIKLPYLVIGGLVLLLVILFYVVKLPEGENHNATEEQPKEKFSMAILKIPQVRNAVIAQFAYVGAQVCVGSFFIRYARYVMEMPEKDAAYLWGSIAMVGFMVGRFMGTFLMRFIAPPRLLLIYSFIGVALMLAGTFMTGPVAVYCVMASPFFMSIMFPTIFALGINGLGHGSQMASSLLVMSIVGGAFFPLIMGQVSDLSGGNIQLAYIVPLFCFAIVGWFAWSQARSNVAVVVGVGH